MHGQSGYKSVQGRRMYEPFPICTSRGRSRQFFARLRRGLKRCRVDFNSVILRPSYSPEYNISCALTPFSRHKGHKEFQYSVQKLHSMHTWNGATLMKVLITGGAGFIWSASCSISARARRFSHDPRQFSAPGHGEAGQFPVDLASMCGWCVATLPTRL